MLARVSLLLCTLLTVLMLPCSARADTTSVIRLASTAWPPWSGSRLASGGLATRVIQYIFASSGLTIEVTFLPWTRAMHETLTGAYDGVFPSYKTLGREEQYLISEAYMTSSIAILGRRTTPATWQGLSDLYPFRIGVVRGYANTADFDADRHLTKDEATNDEQNLKKLAVGRVDMAVIDRGTATWLMEENPALEPPNWHWLSPPLANKTLHILFNRKRGAIRQRFDQAIRSLVNNGELEGFVRTLGAPYALPVTP